MDSILDFKVSVREQDGLLIAAHEQAFSDDFMAMLDSQRSAQDAAQVCGDMLHVAAVPAALVDVWHSRGEPIHELSAQEIVKRLRREDLHRFIMTNRTF